MDTTILTEKFNAFRNHPVTVKAATIGKQALTAVAVGLTIKVVTYIAVAGTSVLIAKINERVNGTTD